MCPKSPTESSRPVALLAADMDGTVIPLDHRRSRIAEIAEFRSAVASRPDLRLAYVTGRHLALALDGMRTWRLPLPDWLVCDVGTSVYYRKGKAWCPDAAYERRMKRCLGSHTGASVSAVLAGTRGLRCQEPEKQAPFKRSYYFDPREDLENLLRRIRRRLKNKKIRANLVTSVDPVAGVGLLDVLPAEVAKDYALRVLRRRLRLSMSDVVYAGDSGNDLLVFAGGFKSIVVANAPPAVREVLRAGLAAGRLTGDIYFARHRYARGVVEGARHFGLFA